jgi:hypothetical protein
MKKIVRIRKYINWVSELTICASRPPYGCPLSVWWGETGGAGGPGERGGAGGSVGERGGGMSSLGMLGERGGEGLRGEQFGYAGCLNDCVCGTLAHFII